MIPGIVFPPNDVADAEVICEAGVRFVPLNVYPGRFREA